MSDGTQLKTWVSRETKERFTAVARYQGLSDSALLKRLVDLMLRSTDPAAFEACAAARLDARRSRRLTIRLRPDDETLLAARASARGMASATYLSVLARAHLRSLAPLPRDELQALKRSVSELGSIGRNLNQIARAANQGERAAGPGRDDLRAILRVCEGLRDHVKGLLAANLRSWDRGHAD
jgi:predicted DNA binding CopG/RHH family protein